MGVCVCVFMQILTFLPIFTLMVNFVPRGQVVKSAVSTLATCEMSQVLLAGVPGGFSRGSPVFAQLHY